MARFDAAQIERETSVASVEIFESLSSTNDYAITRVGDENLLLPLLVIAEEQIAGRGRGANQWWSSEGALTFSLLVDGLDNVPAAFLSLAVGVGLCDAVRSMGGGFDAGLKWPNDIFLGDKKAGGILIECPAAATGQFVIGIGLNVNNSIADAPPEVVARATSLSDVAGELLDSQRVLIMLLQHVEDAIAAIDADLQGLQRRWQELCILSGRQVTLETSEGTLTGICQGIADDGALLVETPQGQKRCLSGSVLSFR